MKKRILGVVLSSIALPINAEPTLYGIAGVVITSQDTENAAGESINPGIQVNSGAISSSRIGVKGEQKLTENLEAIYKFEGGVGVDTGSFSGFTRVAWVGLRGGYGAVTAGLQWTPYDDAYFNIDAQEFASWSAQYMVINNTKGLGGIGSHGDTFNRSNALVYNSPSRSGFTIGAMYAPGEDGESASESSRYTGIRIGYSNGPVSVELSGESQRPAGVSVTNTDAWLLGGSFDAGPFKAYVGYQAADGSAGEDKGYSLGVAVPIAAATKLRVGYANDKTTKATGDVNNGTVQGFSVDIVRTIAPELDVMVLAANVTGKLAGESRKASYREFGVGLRYKF